MENNANRWMATALLLAMFGIIAYAGTRSTARQGVQNVLVTNAANQQVPVLPPARPSANGAYIGSVANTPGVKVVTTPATPVATRDVSEVDAQSAVIYNHADLPASAASINATLPLPNSTPVIIDSVSFNCAANVAGEYVEAVSLDVSDGASNGAGAYLYSLQPVLGSNLYSVYSAVSRIYIPKGGTAGLALNRFGGDTQSANFFYTIDYHTVTQ